MEKQRLMFGILLILLIVGLCGCTNQISNGNNGDYKYTESYEKDIKVDDNVTLIVSTINGKIKVKSWENKEIKIIGVKKVNNKEDIDKINLQINNENNSIYLIVTREIGLISNEAFDLDLMVPSSISIERIDSVNGQIDVSKIPVIREIGTTNGGITVKLKEINNPILLHSTNGNIEVRVDTDLNATFDIRTANGKIIINNNLPFEWIENSSNYKVVKLGGPLVIDLPRVDIITTNGDIELHKLQD